LTCKKCGDTGKVTEYEQLLEFNPASWRQKLDLVRHYKLKVPRKRKTGDETSDGKHLERFAKKFPVFQTILECQRREKMISTYIWKLRGDGRVGTTYGFNPSTWRKSSRQVNLQNIPARNDLARLFRRMLVAAPGHVLLEADSSAIEAVLVGFCAGDPDYIRLAKLGIHDFVGLHWTGQSVNLGLDDATLKVEFHEFKHDYPEIREAAKRGVHGSNYLLSHFGLHDEYPEYFPTRKKAKEFQEFYFGLFPKLRQWQQATIDRAHLETYLDNHFQYRHYFFSVYNRKRTTPAEQQLTGEKWKWVHGEDAKRAVAFVPSSDASAMQTEYLLELVEHRAVAAGLRNLVHDSFWIEVPENDVDQVARQVQQTMTKPFPELGGLSVGVELKVGPNLGEMQPLT
jgi:DNA polymerase-1